MGYIVIKTEIAWKQKFESFEKSYTLFEKILTYYNKNPYSEVGQMALIHSYRVNVKSASELVDKYKYGDHISSLSVDLVTELFRTSRASDTAFWVALDARQNYIYNKKELDRLLKIIAKDYENIYSKMYIFLRNELELLDELALANINLEID